jgi:YD repeat-containing protein
MRGRPAVRFALWLVITLGVTSCGGGSAPGAGDGAPTAPTPPNSPAICRTYATATSTFGQGPLGSSTIETQCTFDRPSLHLTCRVATSAPGGCSSEGTSVISYSSISDFVDEGSAIGRVLRTGTQSTGSLTGCSLAGSSSGYDKVSFDSQRRVTSIVSGVQGGSVTQTFSSWDSIGRYTAGTTSDGSTLSFSYDDASKRMTSTSTARGSTVTSTYIYDSTNMPVKATITLPNGTLTQTTTTASTAQVCK